MNNPFSIDLNTDSQGRKKGTVLFYDPAHITTRLAVQRGCFTVHSSRYKTSLVEWPGEFGLQKIEIPYKHVKQVRKTLWQLGNRGSNVFPGLDGIALDIVAAFEVGKRHSNYPL